MKTKIISIPHNGDERCCQCGRAVPATKELFVFVAAFHDLDRAEFCSHECAHKYPSIWRRKMKPETKKNEHNTKFTDLLIDHLEHQTGALVLQSDLMGKILLAMEDIERRLKKLEEKEK